MITQAKTIPINDPKTILLRRQILDTFFKVFSESKQFQPPFDFLEKKGENHSLRGLEFQVFALPTDPATLSRIDYMNFAKDALTKIDSYRMVGSRVYQKLPTLSMNVEDGDYLLASNGEPAFIIQTSPVNGTYVFSSVTFEPFERGVGVLRYTPANQKNPEERPDEVRLEVETPNEENVLYQTFRKLLENYAA